MILVCGEALMDVFAAGETSTGLSLDARVGGSPFNVAIGLARLAQRSAFLAAVSSGFMGDRLMHALRAEGVDTAAIVRTPARTTISLIGLDSHGVPSYDFYGDGAADRQLMPAAIAALPQGISAIHIGSFATVVEPIAGTLRVLVEREHRRTVISYDPNLRLNVEPEQAKWRAMLEFMLPRSHLLKISDEDLGLLLPDTTPERFAADALAQGVGLVVVTRGANGATGWTAHGRADAGPAAVEVVDTVGAGDTFQAALLAWLAEHGRLGTEQIGTLRPDQTAAALAFAAQAAAITCSRRGADMPRRAELPAV